MISMVVPCSAHESQLTMLIGASSITPNTYTRRDGNRFMQSALVSYGKVSDRLHIWAIVINEWELTLDLEVLLIVKMTAVPRSIVLSGSTVCMAMEDNCLTMFKNRTIRRQSFTPQVVNIATMELIQHQTEDSHKDTVTSLNVCSYLKLFVSSSKDGTIKVWSFNNQMVSEIDFGEPLTSVGFANDQGDLLVGLQLRISIIKAADYLPEEYYQVSKNCPHWDERAKPVAFDPLLEFWSVY
jgi:WD40 repeat protein